MKRGMIAMSIVAVMSLQAEESKISIAWEASPQYQEFVKMGAEASEPAKKLREETVLSITLKELERFKNEIEPKFQANMANKIDALPNGLKALLAEIDLKLKPDLYKKGTESEFSTFNIFLYQYIESILYSKGMAEKKIRDIAERYPELQNKASTNYLVKIGKLYDDNAKIKENIAKMEKEIAKSKEEIAKSKEEIAKWNEIIEKLKKL